MFQKKILYVFLGILLLITSCSFTNREPSEKERVLIDVVDYVLSKGHYSPINIDDQFSKKVFHAYFERLDPLKRYFLRTDIKSLAKYEYAIDDLIKNKDLKFFNEVHDLYIKRLKQAKELSEQTLKNPFDLHVKGKFNMDYEHKDYPKNQEEFDGRWNKHFSISILSNYRDKTKEENDSINSLSESEIEKISRKLTTKNYKELFDRFSELEKDDYFILYLNTIVEEFDPHTFYFAPDDKEDFDASMSGKFEGIGAVLSKQENKIKIVEIISGGPVWKQKALEVGDWIIEVGKDEDTPMVNVGSMRLRDAIKLIKGPKDTKVFMKVKRVDGTIENISIVRGIVEIEETYVKTALVKEDGHTYAVIDLPKFYIDFEDYKKRNAASDIKKELVRLNYQNVDGVLLDLRGNGGGSLKTVVDIGGMFIPQGSIVQVRSAGNKIEQLKDQDPSVIWKKPLVILVNSSSASASEILAAAMQDYHRAIIIGSPQTYGKGTVQNVYDLNKMIRKNDDLGDLGAIKITTQKFYRVNGGSTQLEGVKSDIIIPDKYSYIKIGEKELDNALPWDKIPPSKYTPIYREGAFDRIIKKSNDRIKNSKIFKLIDKNAQWVKKQQDEKEYDLDLDAFVKDLDQKKEKSKKFDTINKYDNKLSFKSMPYEIDLIKKDTILKEKRERWHKDLKKDPYIEEGLHVLRDWSAVAN